MKEMTSHLAGGVALVMLPVLCLSPPPAVAQEEAPAGEVQVTERPDSPLYPRLGGREVLAAVARDFVARVSADPDLTRLVAGMDDQGRAALRERIANRLCALAGGPCDAPPLDFEALHRQRGVTLEDWDRGVEHLAAALQGADVPRLAREDLLTAVMNLRARLAGVIQISREAWTEVLETAPPRR